MELNTCRSTLSCSHKLGQGWVVGVSMSKITCKIRGSGLKKYKCASFVLHRIIDWTQGLCNKYFLNLNLNVYKFWGTDLCMNERCFYVENCKF